MFMFDGAYDAALIAACKTAGGVAMSHYLTGAYVTTSAQVAAIRAAGMGAVLNYEVGAAELVNATRAQGQAVGMRAVNAVDPACPRDGTVGIYFSVDTGVMAGQITACDAAFAGIRDVLHGEFRVKVYGESALIEHLCAQHLVDGKQWLSESTFGMPYLLSPNVCMVQNHDAAGNWLQSPVPATDVNTILDVYALDAWWPPNSPYEGDAPMTPAELQAIIDGVHAALQPDLLRLAGWLAGNENAVFNGKSLPTVPAGVALSPTAAAPASQALLRVAALQAQVQAVADQVAAVPTVHPTVDVQALADAVAAKLPQTGLTAAEITAAVTAAAPTLIFRGGTS